MFKVTALAGFGGKRAAPPVLTFIGSTANTTNGVTQTYSSHAIGTPSADRLVVVGISAQFGSNGTISGVTVGGVSMDQVIAGADLRLPCVLFSKIVAAGTTADIVVTHSTSSQNTSNISVWTITGLNSTTAEDTGGSEVDPLVDTLDISAGGVAIGHMGRNESSGSVAWTNLTEQSDAVSENLLYSSAGDSFASSQSALSITANPTGSNAAISMVLAAWR